VQRAKLRVAVLISGSGTNLQALIDACASTEFPARIVLVISNRAIAAGLKRAELSGIPTKVIPHNHYPSREAFDAAIDASLRSAGVEFVCLAGFMRLLTPGFVNLWRDRLINIHPSLLPAFKGMDAVEQALAAGVRTTGCTVHLYARKWIQARSCYRRKCRLRQATRVLPCMTASGWPNIAVIPKPCG
jgi:phosphoribosylglycinamide formyltransferase-1